MVRAAAFEYSHKPVNQYSRANITTVVLCEYSSGQPSRQLDLINFSLPTFG